MSGWATRRRRTEGRAPRLSGASAHSRRPRAGGPCIVMRDARHSSEMATMINGGNVAGVVAWWWWWLFGAFGAMGLKLTQMCNLKGSRKKIHHNAAHNPRRSHFVYSSQGFGPLYAGHVSGMRVSCEWLDSTRPQAHHAQQTTGNKRARRASPASGVQLAAEFLATSFVASRATGHGASNAPALGALASSGCTSQRLLSTQHSATSEMIHDLSWSDAQLNSRERPTTPIAGAPWRSAQTVPEHSDAAIKRL